MSSPYTVTKLVRWRIRDWVSCFYACRFPLEEESNKLCAMTPQKPSRKMVFDPIGDSRKNRKKKLNKKMEQRKKEKVKVSAEKGEKEGENDSSWPRFSEEDYIVFCFEDDGGIHIVEDRKSEVFHQKIDHANVTSKSVCRKLKYVEDVSEFLPQSKNDTISVDGENSFESAEEQIPVIDDKDQGKGIDDMEDEWPPAVVKEISHIGEVSDSKTTPSAESSDSNYSTGSTGSFAFPVLGWELMGSPAQMPKPEEDDEDEEEEEGGPRFGKHKAWCSVRHHCCKF
ncbi:protein BREAKING OF ASYMMETRY IN THE STOMATAL LINEAGE [Solanum lycopersicum]|uniref:Protein BREAKING OF ASYMMETRY IN THE STOMATAL LINEAGE n=1 Tax=Solanum lycopersicum TaxID=4081 RepID=A0A3Q7GGD1_SOLLC|nr:protein BREAKING OF ASYMMETRY IN THE STOMATAL LINEAGE [Solanum lycopersicum]